MSEFPRSLAIVIGINHYQNGISALKTAVPDAEAIAALLKTKQGYEIFPEVILDAAATGDRLKTLLKEALPKQVGKGDRVLFYFAGHGVALDGRDGPEGYLVPQNARPGDKGSMLPMQMLHDELAKLDCRHLLLILDCCFAGAFRWSANYRDVGLEEDLNEQQYQHFVQQPAWQIITSAGSDERAIDVLALGDHRGQMGKHSPFAQVLLDGLAGAADRYPAGKNGAPAGDGVITANELITYIESEFSERLQGQALNQTPGLWCFRKHGNGRYLFDHPDHPRNLKHAPPLDDSTNPYRGLKSFESEDKDLFFGRSELTDKLTEFVKQRPLTVVLGTSGAGKSSLVKAGLIPQIETLQNGQRWAILPFRPENSPFAALNQVLSAHGLPPIKNPLQPDATAPSLENALCGWLQAHPDMQLLVVIDQFEELVTLAGNKERQLFLKALATAIEKYAKQLHLVITLRSDFEPQFKESPLAPFWNNDNFFVTTPMSHADLRQTIEKPAAKRTFFFESGDPEHSLVDRLIHEVEGMPGALPLLSFALSQLYLKYLGRQEAARQQGRPAIDRAITEADYQALGSVQQSITKRADEIYDDLRQGNVSKAVLEKVRQKFRESSDVNEKIAESQIQQVCQSGVSDRVIRNVMLRMVSITGGARSRRQVQCSELAYPESDCIQVAIVLETFEQERLLTTDKDAAGNPYIEPAHDALILSWSKINVWLNERHDKVEPKRQFVLLPVLPAFLKTPGVAFDRSKSDNAGAEAPLKVNLQLQRELTIAANKWESTRKSKPVEQNKPTHNPDASEGNGNHQKNGAKQSNQAVDWLWHNNPRLPLVEQVGRSTDNWLNKIEAEFVQSSFERKVSNSRRNWVGVIGIILALSSATVVAVKNAIDAQNQLLESNSSLTESLFTSGKELDALVQGTETGELLKQTWTATEATKIKVLTALQQVVYGVRERSRIPGETMTLSGVSFSPDGKTIAAAGSDGMIKLWTREGQLVGTLTQHQNNHADSIVKIIFSDNGQVLISASFHSINLWQRQPDGRLIFYKSIADPDGIMTLALSPDNKTIATASLGAKNIIKLRNLDGKVLNRLEGHRDRINDLSFSVDGRTIVSASADKTIKLWSTKDAKLLNTISESSPMFAARFVDDQTIAYAGANRMIKLWKWKTGKLSQEFFVQHSGDILRLALSQDGKRLAAASSDHSINLWRLDGTLLHTLSDHEKAVTDLSFSPDSQNIASISDDNTLRIWNLDNAAPTFKGDTLSVSPNGQMIVAGDDKTISLWHSNGTLLKRLPEHEKFITRVSFSPDGKIIATASADRTVKLWDLDGKLLKTLQGHQKAVTSISFSPDGQMIASGSLDHTAKLWSLDGRLLKTLQGHQKAVTSISFSPDGKMIASGSQDRTVKLWDLQGNLLQTVTGSKAVLDVSFSPDSTMLASAGEDKTVIIWHLNRILWYFNVEQAKIFPVHNSNVFRARFSPNGQILVSASENEIKLWTLDGTLLRDLSGEHVNVQDISFSPDGQTLVFSDADQVIALNLDLDQLLDRSCRYLHGYLTYSKDSQDSRTRLCSHSS